MTLPGNPHILHIDTGRTWRGGQGQVLTLCRGLQETGVPQTLIAPPGSPLMARAIEAGIPVIPLRMRGEIDLMAMLRIRQIVKRHHSALLHCHDAHAHTLAVLALGNSRGVRIVVSRRVDFPISRGWLSRRKYANPAIHYFAISNGVRDVLIQGGIPIDRIHLVHSGVDPNRFPGEANADKVRQRHGIPPGAPLIGTIGSLVDHKGHRYLIDAMPAILKRFPDARLLIVGDGELEQDLIRQIGRLGLQDLVTLAGYRDDVETYLCGFDLYALPSHLEGLCTSLIDAMLFERPIVATRTGGVPDLIADGKTGLLVAPRDPDALASGIIRLLLDAPLRHELAMAARRHALGHFTNEALLRNTLEAYSRVLSV